MSLTTASLTAIPLLAVVAMLAALLPRDLRNPATGLASTLLGVSIAATGALALGGRAGRLDLPMALPTGDLVVSPALAPDALGGFFLVVVGVVGALGALYGIGYAHGPAASRTAWASYPLFLLGMALVPAAADVMTFLVGWELMALASTVLLLAEHASRPSVRSAALLYAVLTHLSFLLVALGFALLVDGADSTSFADIAAAAPRGGLATAAFVLLTLGFATKAGLVPLHGWLPRAHPEAPSHVSAVMSAAMVKLGVYGILLVALRLLPGGPRWWGAGLAVLGAVSAVYGILQASVISDLKRLLAYSTTENVGLAVTAVGVGLVLRSAGQDSVADIALVAALLLVASHALFKTALFLGAGAVLHATGERDLDRLGGLRARMQTTTWTFGAAALGAAALPVTSGFVAEWMLLQAVVHGDGVHDRLVAVLFPLLTAVVALTAGLALLTFVKAYGTAFLGRPRSHGAASATEAGPWERLAMSLAAAGVVLLGVLPALVIPALARAVSAPSVTRSGLSIDVPGAGTHLDPAALTLLAVALAIPCVAAALRMARRRPTRQADLAWGCGQSFPSPRMQYNATSYAEPLVRVFAATVRTERQLSFATGDPITHGNQSVQFEQQTEDVVQRGMDPIAASLLRLGDRARRIQNGSIHRYLGVTLVTLLVVLLAVTW